MQIADAILNRASFLPGQQVLFSIGHRCGHITITPNHDYMIGNRYMTQEQIRQRSRLSTD